MHNKAISIHVDAGMRKKMKVCSIASGSSGNCTYIEDGSKRILVDAGISRKRIVEGRRRLDGLPGQG